MRGRSKERTRHIDIRVSDEEWEMIHDTAADYRLDVSSFLRHLAQRASLERLGVPPRPAIVAERRLGEEGKGNG